MSKRKREQQVCRGITGLSEEYTRLIRGIIDRIAYKSAPFADGETIRNFIRNECFWYLTPGYGGNIDAPELMERIAALYIDRHAPHNRYDRKAARRAGMWSLPKCSCCAERLHLKAKARFFVAVLNSVRTRNIERESIRQWCSNLAQYWSVLACCC